MTRLLVTVDTEEDGAFREPYAETEFPASNVHSAGRFQLLCDKYEVRPTYLVSMPVVEDDTAVALLRGYQDENRCEIGTHVHPWCNAPHEEEKTPHNSYLCNLPEPLQRAKLETLTDAIESRFGRRPTSFRAGRYGMGMPAARVLKDLGYVVDSSVIPFLDYSDRGGPDFREAPYLPYYLDGDDFLAQHNSGFMLEVPVSVGFTRPDFRRAQRRRKRALRSPWRQLRMVGILDRLGISRRVKLSPEQADAEDMIRLVDALVAQQAACVVLMFHSSSLVPGFSPYVKDEAALKTFYNNLETVIRYCRQDRQMSASTLTEFAEDFSRTADDEKVSASSTP